MDWLTTPEAQATPHYWLATAAGHVVIGAAMWSTLSCFVTTRKRAALATAWLYLMWEIAQVSNFGGDPLDSLFDGAFVVGGALLAWAAWAHLSVPLAACVAVLMLIGASGVPKNRDDDV